MWLKDVHHRKKLIDNRFVSKFWSRLIWLRLSQFLDEKFLYHIFWGSYFKGPDNKIMGFV